MKRRSSSNKLVNGLLLVAMSAAAGAQAQSPPLEAGSSDRMFQVFGSDSPELKEMQARLEDPQLRAKALENYRRSIADSHYGVADALQLDAATFDELVELLAVQQLEQSDHFHKIFAGKVPPNPTERIRNEADRITENVDALRKVLGQEKLERYQRLQFSIGQRRQVREFDERLDASHKLSSTQRERMVQLLNEHLIGSVERHMLDTQRMLLFDNLREMPSRELRDSQLQSITSSEEMWRNMRESNRRLRESAAEFLTEPQLATLAQIHEEQGATLQQRIVQMREQAGLSPTIPEQPQVAEASLATVERKVKVSLMASVNNENPRYLTTVVSSGKSVSLKIADGLFLEATPIVFENDAYNLRVQYFEEGATGRRLIGNSGRGGRVLPASQDGSSRRVGGGGSSVLTGSKGYAVELSALVEST